MGALSLAVPLFLPRVTVDVITVHLPEAGPLVSHQLDAAHPLRALPEVQVRYHPTQRPSLPTR